MVWNRIKTWWGQKSSTTINDKETADYLHHQLDEISREIEEPPMNEFTQGADLFIDTEKLIRFFYRRQGYIYSNEFFSVNTRNIMEYFGMSEYLQEQHNTRSQEWSSNQHEKRVAYLIAKQAYEEPFIEIDVHVIESGIYDLLLVDGYHRLLAASLMMRPKIRVKMKDNYTMGLAIEILSELQ